jgi:hypothetical protein
MPNQLSINGDIFSFGDSAIEIDAENYKMNFNADVKLGGAFEFNAVEVVGNHLLTSNYQLLRCHPEADMTITISSAVIANMHRPIIISNETSDKTVTVTTQGTEKISGVDSKNIPPCTSLSFYSSGENLFIF